MISYQKRKGGKGKGKPSQALINPRLSCLAIANTRHSLLICNSSPAFLKTRRAHALTPTFCSHRIAHYRAKQERDSASWRAEDRAGGAEQRWVLFRESVWWGVTWYRVTGGRAGEAFVPRKGSKEGLVRRRAG